MTNDFETLKKVFSWIEGITFEDKAMGLENRQRINLPSEGVAFHFKNGNLIFVENTLNC
jgi:hypothetical protein